MSVSDCLKISHMTTIFFRYLAAHAIKHSIPVTYIVQNHQKYSQSRQHGGKEDGHCGHFP